MDKNSQESDWNLKTILKAGGTGAAAGLVATVPMTAVMLLVHRYLPLWQRHSLPPRKIAMSLAGRLGVRKHMDSNQRTAATVISHFAYGTGAGAVYGPLSRLVPLPPVIKGAAYGLLIWAASYAGWLPAMNMPAAATDETAKRNAMMIVAHLLFGGVTGVLAHLLDR